MGFLSSVAFIFPSSGSVKLLFFLKLNLKLKIHRFDTNVNSDQIMTALSPNTSFRSLCVVYIEAVTSKFGPSGMILREMINDHTTL